MKEDGSCFYVRFSGRLNDFLKPVLRNRRLSQAFKGNPSLFDALQALGVPHTEIGGIRRSGSPKPVSIDAPVKKGESFRVSPRRPDASPEKFILDVHLGKLARSLRLLGFDALYRNDYSDHRIVSIAARTGRFVLTRDVGLLKHRAVENGYWIRSQDPEGQIGEVIGRFRLRRRAAPFRRCLACNGLLRQVEKNEVEQEVPPESRRRFNEFYRCRGCGKIYWPGTHYGKLRENVLRWTGGSGGKGNLHAG